MRGGDRTLQFAVGHVLEILLHSVIVAFNVTNTVNSQHSYIIILTTLNITVSKSCGQIKICFVSKQKISMKMLNENALSQHETIVRVSEAN